MIACPQCESTTLEQIASGSPDYHLNSRMVSYKCGCGLAFTRTVKLLRDPAPTLAALPQPQIAAPGPRRQAEAA